MTKQTPPNSGEATGPRLISSQVESVSGPSSGRRRGDELAIAAIPAAELTENVRQAIEALQRELTSLRAERARLFDQLKQVESLADHDPLANVLNRRAFLRELDRVIGFSARFGVDAAVLYFDLNGFKQVNDRHGHQAGDALIRHVAQTLLRHTRDSDMVGRVGGDEFAVILTKASAEGAARKAGELARALRAAPLRFGRESLRIGASVGFASFEKGDNALSALARADSSMYADKARARVQAL